MLLLMQYYALCCFQWRSQKCQLGGDSLLSLFFLPPFVFIVLFFFFTPFRLLSSPIFLSFLPLKSPKIQLGGLEEHCDFHHRGLERSRSRNRIEFDAFSFQKMRSGRNNFNYFSENKLIKSANLAQYKRMRMSCLDDWGHGSLGLPCLMSTPLAVLTSIMSFVGQCYVWADLHLAGYATVSTNVCTIATCTAGVYFAFWA